MSGSKTERGGRVGRKDSPSARVVELDALRGIAAVAVMAYHYTTRYAEQIGHGAGLPLDFAFGNYGVHLFFMISGFVIFMTLERTHTAMDFVVSRFSRLFPAYWVAMAITATVVYTIGLRSQRLGAHDLLLNVTMMQDFLGAEELDGSYWTLEVELVFYAQMLFWFALGGLGRIRWIIGGWLMLSALEGWCEKSGWYFPYALRELLILRFIPFFALGVLFYRLRARPAEWRIEAAIIALAVLAIGVGQKPVLLLVAGICCAIFALFTKGWLRFLNLPLFAFVGGISYTIYLVHQSVGFAVIYRLEHAGVSAWAAVLLAVALAFMLATILHRFVERPAMDWIRTEWRLRRSCVQPA